jgi:hypothetical protein
MTQQAPDNVIAFPSEQARERALADAALARPLDALDLELLEFDELQQRAAFGGSLLRLVDNGDPAA